MGFTAVAPMDDRASGRTERDRPERLRRNRIRNPSGSGFHLPLARMLSSGLKSWLPAASLKKIGLHPDFSPTAQGDTKSVTEKLNVERRGSTGNECTFCGDSKKAARSAPRDDVFSRASSSEVLSYEATQHDWVSEPETEAATEGAGDLAVGVCGSFSALAATVPAAERALTAAASCYSEKLARCCLPFPPLSLPLPLPLPFPLPGESVCLSGLR